MQKLVIPIKEMSAIESVLNEGFVGIAAFRSDDNIVQKTTTYLYLDKNIYFYYNPGDDDFKKIKFDRMSSFSILKNNQSSHGTHLYSFLSITISGKIKPVDDAKVLDAIGKNYLKKYKLKKADLASFAGAIMLDTEEIQAFEESGG